MTKCANRNKWKQLAWETHVPSFSLEFIIEFECSPSLRVYGYDTSLKNWRATCEVLKIAITWSPMPPPHLTELAETSICAVAEIGREICGTCSSADCKNPNQQTIPHYWLCLSGTSTRGRLT